MPPQTRFLRKRGYCPSFTFSATKRGLKRHTHASTCSSVPEIKQHQHNKNENNDSLERDLLQPEPNIPEAEENSEEDSDPDDNQSESSVDPGETCEIDEDEIEFAALRGQVPSAQSISHESPYIRRTQSRRRKTHGNDMQRERAQWDSQLEHIHQEEIRQLHSFHHECQYSDCQSASEYCCMDCNIGMRKLDSIL